MNRASFVAGAAALASAAPLAAFATELVGARLTQRALFAALPRMRSRQWTRIILGSGVKYQKQIGAGTEPAPGGGARYYYETQIGSPGGSCNPSSMRKAYLRDPHFGSLLDAYPLLTNIGRTENMVYRFGDAESTANGNPGDTTLHLLDERYLFDPRELRIVSVTAERIHVASATRLTTHVVAEYGPARSANERLRRVDLWHAPELPFGLARYRGTLRDMEPFEMQPYSFGADFTSMLALRLDAVRAITKDGRYGQLAGGLVAP